MLAAEIVIPFLCAVGYSAAMLLIKRSYQDGVGPYQHLLTVTVVQAAVYSLLLPFTDFPESPDLLRFPLIGMCSFLIAQVFTVLAIYRGDTSLQVPLLGTKVVFVSLFNALLLRGALSAELWIGTVGATIAVFLLGWSRPTSPTALRRGVAYALAAALFFALTDIVMVRGSRELDPLFLLSAFMVGSAVLLLVTLPVALRGSFRVERHGLHWLLPGAVLFVLQSIGFGLTLGLFQRPSLANIIFNSRGLWSLVLVLLLGHSIRTAEAHMTGPTVALRASGAIVMLGTVAIVLL